jgi:uncharacterized protein YgiB involved in biofilm formation
MVRHFVCPGGILPAMRQRRSSVRICLVLVGTAALAGCDSDARYTNRDMYRSIEDCRRDWNRADACQQMSGGTGGAASTWYGPTYDSNLDRPRGSRAIGTASVSRGGFGSTSSFHSSGG